MIKLDLAHWSQAQLEALVTARCSEFGSVSQVVIMQDNQHDFAFALVVMSAASETLAVLRELGDSLLNRIVVIKVKPA